MSTPVIADARRRAGGRQGRSDRRPSGSRRSCRVIALVALLAALTIADPDFLTQRSLTAAVRTVGAARRARRRRHARGAVRRHRPVDRRAVLAVHGVLRDVAARPRRPHHAGRRSRAAGAIGAVQGIAHVVLRIPSFIVTLGGMSIFSAIALVDLRRRPDPGRRPRRHQVADAVRRRLRARCRSSSPCSWWPRSPWSSSSRRCRARSPPPATPSRPPAWPARRSTWSRSRPSRVSGACAGLAAVMLVSRNFSGSPTMADNLLLPGGRRDRRRRHRDHRRPRQPLALARRRPGHHPAARRPADRRRAVGLRADPLRRDHRRRRRAHPRPIEGVDHQVAAARPLPARTTSPIPIRKAIMSTDTLHPPPRRPLVPRPRPSSC